MLERIKQHHYMLEPQDSVLPLDRLQWFAKERPPAINTLQELQQYLDRGILAALAKVIKGLQVEVPGLDYPAVVVGYKEYLTQPKDYKGFKAAVQKTRQERQHLEIFSNLGPNLSVGLEISDDKLHMDGNIEATYNHERFFRKPKKGQYLKHGSGTVLGEPGIAATAIKAAVPTLISAAQASDDTLLFAPRQW